MVTKHNKVATFRDKFPHINSYNPLNMWSREFTLQIKIIYPL